MVSLTAGVLVAILGVSFAAFPNGQLYPFDIDSLLVCHVENPLAGTDGAEDFIAENTPRLSFAEAVRQGDHPHDIILPGPSGFRIPSGSPDTEDLLAFLGEDFDATLTATSLPITAAPKGCRMLPVVEGSGGDQHFHFDEDKDPTPFLDAVTVPGFGEGRSAEFMEIEADPTLDSITLGNFSPFNVGTVNTVLLQEINSELELCDIHTALCPLNNTWAELPEGYFPKYFSQGTCSTKDCSFPRGKTCEVDYTYVGYVSVLRWDCCFDKQLAQIQWACGWRKVQIPMVCDCQCSCNSIVTQ